MQAGSVPRPSTAATIGRQHRLGAASSHAPRQEHLGQARSACLHYAITPGPMQQPAPPDRHQIWRAPKPARVRPKESCRAGRRHRVRNAAHARRGVSRSSSAPNQAQAFLTTRSQRERDRRHSGAGTRSFRPSTAPASLIGRRRECGRCPAASRLPNGRHAALPDVMTGPRLSARSAIGTRQNERGATI